MNSSFVPSNSNVMPRARARRRATGQGQDPGPGAPLAAAPPGRPRGPSRRDRRSRAPPELAPHLRSSLPGMSATAPTDVAWDLEPLVDGDGPDGVDRLLDEAATRAQAFAEQHAGKLADARPAALRRRRQRARRDPGARRAAPATTRTCASPPTPPTPPTARSCSACRRRRPRSRRQLLFFELEWAALDDERAEELLAADGLEQRAPLPAHGAPLPPAPALRARGEDPRREVRHRLVRLVAALRARSRARSRSSCPATRSRSRSTSRSRTSCPPTASCARTTQQAVTAALEPGLRTRGFIFNTLLHDKAVDDRLRSYPTWLASRNLANEASDESVQALVEAVARQLRPAAALVPRSRPGCSGSTGSPTTTASAVRRDADEEPSPGTTRATSCSSPTATSRPSSATGPGASSTSAGSTRRCAPPSAAARSAPTRSRRVHPYVLLNYTAAAATC